MLNIDLDAVIDLVPQEPTNKVKPFPLPTTIKNALTYYLDLSSVVSVDLLFELSSCEMSEIDAEIIKNLIDTCDQSFYTEWIVHDHRNIIGLLEDLPSLRPPIELLLQHLPKLNCRYYSISSSQTVIIHVFSFFKINFILQ
ncbi:NADPH--cytochrome P450 reductase [Thelohanellus kitauei]|uniref:NADPH--cytochrome P450 reductase n=1 Tax=Thelohanellus kitauei TaxID=669202 RepID=A0A0C2J0W7_THEKT|nr:NADPH--cytochrome P450 reductase [Thelohanellus kitauei]